MSQRARRILQMVDSDGLKEGPLPYKLRNITKNLFNKPVATITPIKSGEQIGVIDNQDTRYDGHLPEENELSEVETNGTNFEFESDVESVDTNETNSGKEYETNKEITGSKSGSDSEVGKNERNSINTAGAKIVVLGPLPYKLRNITKKLFNKPVATITPIKSGEQIGVIDNQDTRYDSHLPEENELSEVETNGTNSEFESDVESVDTNETNSGKEYETNKEITGSDSGSDSEVGKKERNSVSTGGEKCVKKKKKLSKKKFKQSKSLVQFQIKSGEQIGVIDNRDTRYESHSPEENELSEVETNGTNSEFESDVESVDTNETNSGKEYEKNKEITGSDSGSDSEVGKKERNSVSTGGEKCVKKKKKLSKKKFKQSRSLVQFQICSNKKYGDKKHCCLFCNQFYHKISRHLQDVHKNQDEVIKVLDLPKKCKKKVDGLLCLVREGDFYHNAKVLELKSGELILTRRLSKFESKRVTYTDFGPCPFCLGFILKKNRWKHTKQCPGLTEEERDNKYKNFEDFREDIHNQSEALLGFGNPASVDVNTEFYENIIATMKNDEIKNILKNDELILRLGAFMYGQFNVSQKEYIRQSMRLLGRFFSCLNDKKNSKDKYKCLSDILKPCHFDSIVEATKKLAVEQKRPEDRPQFEKNSVVLKLGPLLRKVATLYRGMNLRNLGSKKDDRDLYQYNQQQAKYFLTLMDLEWKGRLSSSALSSMKEKKFNDSNLLPLTSDLINLRIYIDKKQEKYLKNLSNGSDSVADWRGLTESTLVSILLFNKRRSGEISKTKANIFENINYGWNKHSQEQIDQMSPLEKELSSKMTVIKIKGKHGRGVPIILTETNKQAVKLLTSSLRKKFIKTNPYLFAIPNYEKSRLRGHVVLKKFCSQIDLKSPEEITGTKLRKYVATVTQLLDLTENEQDWLANHLGHDIRVHRHFYRQQENLIEATHISKLLLLTEKGISTHQGKRLVDINSIDIPMNTIDTSSNSNEDSNAVDCSEGLSSSENSTDDDCHFNKTLPRKKSKPTYREPPQVQKTKRPWSSEESKAVITYFSQQLRKGENVGLETCSNCIKTNKVLKNRTSRNVKDYYYNYLKKLRKKKT